MNDDGYAELLVRVAKAVAAGDERELASASKDLEKRFREAPPTDPVLHSAVTAAMRQLGLHGAGDTSGKPGRRDDSRLRKATARALTVHEHDRDRGQVVEVLVSIFPGKGRVWALCSADIATRISAEAGVTAALLPEGRDGWSVSWQLLPPRAHLTGGSIGLAVAAATRAARDGVDVPSDIAWSGDVASDDVVQPSVTTVTGLTAKLKAAADTNKAGGTCRVVIPAGSGLVREPEGVRVIRVETVEQALRLLPPPGRTIPWRYGAFALFFAPIGLAGWEGTPVADAGLIYALQSRIVGPAPVTSMAVLFMREAEHGGQRQAFRGEWPSILRALHERHAAGVVFDINFVERKPAEDAAIVLAIADTRLPVAFALYDPRSGELFVKPALSTLQGKLSLGITTFEEGFLAAPVRKRDVDLTWYWHLGVLGAAMANGLDPAEPKLSGGASVKRLSLGDRLLPLDPDERLWPEPIARPPASAELPDLTGRVVFIGFDHDDDSHATPAGTLYGVESNAMLAEAIATGRTRASLWRGWQWAAVLGAWLLACVGEIPVIVATCLALCLWGVGIAVALWTQAVPPLLVPLFGLAPILLLRWPKRRRL